MCFSATASFIASGGLAAISVASIVSAKKKEKILAIIPLLFAIQQAFEGFQWLQIDRGEASLVAAYGFLLFAFIIWPIYVPSSIYYLDKNRRWLLRWFIFIGVAVASYFIGLLLTEKLSITEYKNCIRYDLPIPFNNVVNVSYLLITLYLVAIFGPLFSSRYKVLNIYGYIILMFAIIAWFFFVAAFTSVWCFFAAIISVMFFFYIKNKKAFE